jgi:hypothetical protein
MAAWNKREKNKWVVHKSLSKRGEKESGRKICMFFKALASSLRTRRYNDAEKGQPEQSHKYILGM